MMVATTPRALSDEMSECDKLPFPPRQGLKVVASALAEVNVDPNVTDLGTALEPNGYTHPRVVYRAWNLGRRAVGLSEGSFHLFVKQQLDDASTRERNRYWFRFHGIITGTGPDGDEYAAAWADGEDQEHQRKAET